MTDQQPTPPASTDEAAAETTVEVDLAAFLPEGVTLGDDVEDGGSVEGVQDVDLGGAVDADEVEPAASDHDQAEVTGDGPAPEVVPVVVDPPVDTTVLERIEGELADVSAALTAIDEGDLGRSRLLTDLLGPAAEA